MNHKVAQYKKGKESSLSQGASYSKAFFFLNNVSFRQKKIRPKAIRLRWSDQANFQEKGKNHEKNHPEVWKLSPFLLNFSIFLPSPFKIGMHRLQNQEIDLH